MTFYTMGKESRLINDASPVVFRSLTLLVSAAPCRDQCSRHRGGATLWSSSTSRQALSLHAIQTSIYHLLNFITSTSLHLASYWKQHPSPQWGKVSSTDVMRCGWSIFVFTPRGSSVLTDLVQQKAVIKRLSHLLDRSYSTKRQPAFTRMTSETKRCIMCATFTLYSLFPACCCHTYIHQLVTTLTLSGAFDVVADWCNLHLYCNLTQTYLLFSDPEMLVDL